MKFSCERCGKRFSTANEPAGGRVYRVPCGCGNDVILLSGEGRLGAPAGSAGGRTPASLRTARAPGDAALLDATAIAPLAYRAFAHATTSPEAGALAIAHGHALLDHVDRSIDFVIPWSATADVARRAFGELRYRAGRIARFAREHARRSVEIARVGRDLARRAQALLRCVSRSVALRVARPGAALRARRALAALRLQGSDLVHPGERSNPGMTSRVRTLAAGAAALGVLGVAANAWLSVTLLQPAFSPAVDVATDPDFLASPVVSIASEPLRTIPTPVMIEAAAPAAIEEEALGVDLTGGASVAAIPTRAPTPEGESSAARASSAAPPASEPVGTDGVDPETGAGAEPDPSAPEESAAVDPETEGKATPEATASAAPVPAEAPVPPAAPLAAVAAPTPTPAAVPAAGSETDGSQVRVASSFPAPPPPGDAP